MAGEWVVVMEMKETMVPDSPINSKTWIKGLEVEQGWKDMHLLVDGDQGRAVGPGAPQGQENRNSSHKS